MTMIRQIILSSETRATFILTDRNVIVCNAVDGLFDPVYTTPSGARLKLVTQPVTYAQLLQVTAAEDRPTPMRDPYVDRPHLALLDVFAAVGVPKDPQLLTDLVDRFSGRQRD